MEPHNFTDRVFSERAIQYFRLNFTCFVKLFYLETQNRKFALFGLCLSHNWNFLSIFSITYISRSPVCIRPHLREHCKCSFLQIPLRKRRFVPNCFPEKTHSKTLNVLSSCFSKTFVSPFLLISFKPSFILNIVPKCLKIRVDEANLPVTPCQAHLWT